MIETAKKKGMKIVAFRDCHEENDVEFETYPPHCLRGSEEAELIPEIKVYEDDMYIIDKPTTNGFNTKEFRGVMARNNFDNIIVCGCCTDICVQNFVLSLKKYFDKAGKNTQIYVYEKGVATFDSEVHNAKEIQEKSLNLMKNCGINVIFDKESKNEKNY